jgi:hemolysin III
MIYMKKVFREPFNGISHLIGAILSTWGLVALLKRANLYGTSSHIIAFAIFGASLIMLYTTSAIYHLVNASEEVINILRHLDHMMIYILIAGTYTPFCVIAFGSKGTSILIAIWVLAIIGVVTTGFWLNAPRWFYTLIYLVMGWLIVVKTPLTIRTIGMSGFGLLLAGGILYSIGAFIYATKRPKIASSVLGFHEIFHLFIMAGSFCHYWAALTKLI